MAMTADTDDKALSAVWRRPSSHRGVELASILKAGAVIVANLGGQRGVLVAWSGTRESYTDQRPADATPQVFLSPMPLESSAPFDNKHVDAVIGLAVHEATHVKRGININNASLTEEILDEIATDAQAARKLIPAAYLAAARQYYWDKAGGAAAHQATVAACQIRPDKKIVLSLWKNLAIYNAPIPEGLTVKVMDALVELLSISAQATRPRANIQSLARMADYVLGQFDDSVKDAQDEQSQQSTTTVIQSPMSGGGLSGSPQQGPDNTPAIGEQGGPGRQAGQQQPQQGEGQAQGQDASAQDNSDEGEDEDDTSEESSEIDADRSNNATPGPSPAQNIQGDSEPEPVQEPPSDDSQDDLGSDLAACLRHMPEHFTQLSDADVKLLGNVLEYITEDLTQDVHDDLKVAGISVGTETILMSRTPDIGPRAQDYLQRVSHRAGELASMFDELKRKRTRNIRGLQAGRVSSRRLYRAGIGDDHLFQKRSALGSLDMALVLLLDNSSSINVHEWRQMREIAALCVSGLRGVKGLSLAIVSYYRQQDHVLLHRLYDAGSPQLKLGNTSLGDTPSGQALAAVHVKFPELAGHARDRLILHVTDGMPSDMQGYPTSGLFEQVVINRIRADGITVLGILVCQGDPSRYRISMERMYGPHGWQFVLSYDKLPQALQDMLRRQLERVTV